MGNWKIVNCEENSGGVAECRLFCPVKKVPYSNLSPLSPY